MRLKSENGKIDLYVYGMTSIIHLFYGALLSANPFWSLCFCCVVVVVIIVEVCFFFVYSSRTLWCVFTSSERYVWCISSKMQNIQLFNLFSRCVHLNTDEQQKKKNKNTIFAYVWRGFFFLLQNLLLHSHCT